MNGTFEPDDLKRVVKQAIHEDAKDRRERIATAVLAGFAADPNTSAINVPREQAIRRLAIAAVEWADALIAELDK